MKSYSRILGVLVLLSTVGSCADSTSINTNVHNLDVVQGYVAVYDTFPSPIALSFKGVEVRLENTAFVAITDETGAWQMKDVPPGTYDLSASKPGFGRTRVLGLSVTAGSTNVESLQLGREPTGATTIQSLQLMTSTQFGGELVLQILGTTTSSKPIKIFFDRDSTTPSCGPHLFSVESFLAGTPWKLESPISNLRSSSLNAIFSGDTLYVSAGSVNEVAGTYEIDRTDHRSCFVSAAPKSNVMSFIVP